MLIVIEPAGTVCPAVGEVMVNVAFAGRGADALVGDGEAIAEADGTAEAARPGEADGEAAADGEGAVAGFTAAVVGAAGAAVGALGAAEVQAAAHRTSPVLSAKRRCIGGVPLHG